MPQSDLFPRACRAVLLGLLGLLVTLPVGALESPTSYGEVAKVDTPVLRLPLVSKAPVIDGVMSPGEWEDSSALSGFWYDWSQADFRYLASHHTQVQLYACYDKDYIYFLYEMPIYPENTWMKARARFPDVVGHPLYGLQWDDHIELEIRPYHDAAKGFALGLFKWFVNPINTVSDQYWSQQFGEGKNWTSKILVRSSVDTKMWLMEIAVPLKELVVQNYTGTEENGQPLVTLPPPDGTIYRGWFTRAIGGNGAYFNAWDSHVWNTTKTQLILDSKAPSFQLNNLGPIMDDIVDVTLTVKNHNTRSETVRLGFFIENSEGLIYSSYESPDLKDGLLELRPGEQRKLRLRQPMPGISRDGNALWFDVRAAGTPAKTLYRTRLVRFHGMEGGRLEEYDGDTLVKSVTYKQRRLDIIAVGSPPDVPPLRPPRKDFDFRHYFSSYSKRVAGIVDIGVHGASEDARRAKEARLSILKDNEDEDVVKEEMQPVRGNFACFVMDLPTLVKGESYKVNLLLFDENKRIVGEVLTEPFTYTVEVWQGNKLGLEDVVWEPFTPMVVRPDGFETLKHRFTVGPLGLPAQIEIKADPRDLPLEWRGKDTVPPEVLLAAGRGPQLRSPMRLEVIVDGKRESAKVLMPAKLVRTWKSELEYHSKIALGPLTADLIVQYDCDGSMHTQIKYGSETPAKIEGIEWLSEFTGTLDLMLSAVNGGGMAGADTWECTLPMKPGVVWDGMADDQMELFYSRFIPWFWFGSGERGFSFYSDSDQGWLLDKAGNVMMLERDAQMQLSWRVKLANHPVTVQGQRRIDFSLLVHPAKPKPPQVRTFNWHYRGDVWAEGYILEPIELDEAYLKARWRNAARAPKDMPYEEAAKFRKDEPPFTRYGRWRNVGVTKEMDQEWEDKGIYYLERQVRVGRRVGWWWDEYWPVGFGRSDNLAMGNSYLRDPANVVGDELPWQSQFLTRTMRGLFKRLGRVHAINNVPLRSHTWSNNASLMIESFVWNSLLVEECGAQHRSLEVDMITQFPNSLYRYICHGFTGLAVVSLPDSIPVKAGDNKMYERQYYGRALLHDIGVSSDGPHGRVHHREQVLRLLKRLTDFGYFDEGAVEFVPYWRNQEAVQLGAAKPAPEVYTSAYRKALPDGKGYEVLLVVMNESLKDVELPLRFPKPELLFGPGGKNTQNATAVPVAVTLPPELAEWWAREGGGAKATDLVLLDLETGNPVLRQPGAAEAYGPLFVPTHDYRLLYAKFEKGD